MKHLIIIALLISSVGFAQTQEGQDIIVNVTNIDNEEGKTLFALYTSEGAWLKTPEKGLMAKIEDGKSTVTFKNVAAGVYAVSMFHDENDNNKIDMNFIGIPKEDNGCSNNAPARFGPPKWEDAKFQVSDKTIIQNIKL